MTNNLAAIPLYATLLSQLRSPPPDTSSYQFKMLILSSTKTGPLLDSHLSAGLYQHGIVSQMT